MRKLEFLRERFSVMKLAGLPPREVLETPFCFLARTDGEISLVCPEEAWKNECIAREDGWRAFRVCGSMEFSLIGILAHLSDTLARAGVSLFAVSTYDTDYVLIKEESLVTAYQALKNAGYEMCGLEKAEKL